MLGKRSEVTRVGERIGLIGRDAIGKTVADRDGGTERTPGIPPCRIVCSTTQKSFEVRGPRGLIKCDGQNFPPLSVNS